MLLHCGCGQTLWSILEIASEKLNSTAPPLFMKDSDIGTSEGTSIIPYGMRNAIIRTTGLNKLVGIHKINNLWRRTYMSLTQPLG